MRLRKGKDVVLGVLGQEVAVILIVIVDSYMTLWFEKKIGIQGKH